MSATGNESHCFALNVEFEFERSWLHKSRFPTNRIVMQRVLVFPYLKTSCERSANICVFSFVTSYDCLY